MDYQNPPISFLQNKKLFIFDMDGTIYLGNKVFPYAIRFIKNLRASGKKVLFFTNNASHSKSFYVEKLNRLNFETNEIEIMTSGDVTAEFLLRHRKGKNVYLVGTEDLYTSFLNYKIPLVNGDRKDVDIVVSSFDTSLTYDKLNNACRHIRNGAEFLSTHPDYNCPTEDGFIPDSGAISAFITASTGKQPTYFGKPYKETVDMICEYSGMKKEDMVFFGDRLYTDIAIGKKHGVTAVLVLSGETQKEDLLKTKKEDFPDYVFPSLNEVDISFFNR